LSVEVPAQEALELRISEAFGSVLEQVEQDTGNRTDAEWAIPYVRRARDLIVALGRRWETLRCIGEYLALKQEPFVLGSAAQPCPLTRRAVAQALGLHESTIGRAISGKTVLLPGGRIVPLSVFFGVAPLQADLDRVLRLQQEHGLSDRQVAETLRSQGIEVSRRTVAKYRKEGTSPQAIGPLKRHGS
jgi:RNA polymerase sigma-54 factor